MAIITLPTSGFVEAKPTFMDYSTQLEPQLGGEFQQIVRPGSRFALEISLPRKRFAELGAKGAMQWISRLNQAKHGEALYPWPQPGLTVPAMATPRVNGANQLGSVLIIDGATAGAAYREGQFISIIHNGNRYLHMITADGTLAGGAGSLPIFPMLRASPADNALVEFNPPMIQGRIVGDSNEWTLDYIRSCGLQFIIAENR